MAGRELSPAQVECHIAEANAIGGPSERRRKSVRVAYLGDILLRLEGSGFTSKRACELAPWIARGAPSPRPFLPALSREQRRGAINKRRLLERELRAANLNPESEPRSCSQREREASQARQRQLRQEHDERGRELTRRWSLAGKRVRVPYAGVALAGIVLKLLRNGTVPDAYAAEGEEVAVALARLKRLDPQRWETLRGASNPDIATVKPSARHIESCLEWLVACTDAAHDEAGVPVPPSF